MKVYFSEASLSNIEEFGDEGMFTVETLVGTRYFYCGVEHGTNSGGMDEVRIFDTCNRTIPIAVENIPSLIQALNYCYDNVQKINEAERLQDRMEDDSHSFVENEDFHPYVEEV